MCKAPFLDEAQGGTRLNAASQDFPIKRKGCLLTLLLGMEVRQPMLAIEHANNDPEECGNNRHVRSVSFFLCPPNVLRHRLAEGESGACKG